MLFRSEANAYKNAQTNRWKVLNALVKPDTWLWMLTGTPAAQSPVDAYGLAKLVNPLGVPKFFGSFKDMVMYKVTQFKWVPKPTALETVFNATMNQDRAHVIYRVGFSALDFAATMTIIGFASHLVYQYAIGGEARPTPAGMGLLIGSALW